MVSVARFCIFFFFNDTATTEIYTLSLHDALPIWSARLLGLEARALEQRGALRHIGGDEALELLDRKSTRLNSSHLVISYAVFCLKKKKKTQAFATIHLKRTASYRLPPSSAAYSCS